MRSFTMTLLGLAVALPVGIASIPAHADSDGYYNQTQRFDNGWGDHGDRYRRNDEDAQRYGWNNNRDDDWRNQQRGEWNRDQNRWRHPGQQFGYNGNERDWNNNNGWHSGNRLGDNDRNDRSDSVNGDND